MQKATLPGITTGTILGPGAVVSGRFQIERLHTMVGQMVLYSAKDQKTQRAIALWAVPPGVIRPDVVTATRSAVKSASAVVHANLVVPFGSSTDPSGALFVASEPLGPTHVAELIEKKRAEDHVHGVHAAYQLLAPVMNGLIAAHPTLAHGAVMPSLIRVDAAGHVKLAGLGLVAPLVATHAVDEVYLAPEVRKGASPTPKSDVYSVGVILFELVTGKAPTRDVAPSSLVSGLPIALDIIMEQCLADDPNDRFDSLSHLKAAMASLVAPSAAPPPSSEQHDVPVEFDVDMDVNEMMSHPPAAPSAPPVPAPRAPVPPPSMGLGPSPIAPMVDPGEALRPSTLDLKGLLDQATNNDAPRWMFVRGGLDHGPLSARELIQAIVRNEVLEDDIVFNMDSGDRRKLTEWAQYREFAEQARDKRRKDLHAREVKSAIAEESVSTRAKSAVAVALVLVAGGIGFAYYKTLGPGRSVERRQAELDDALAHGQLRLAEGGLQVLESPPPPPAGSTHHSAGGGGGGGGGFAGSYEAAMNQPIEFNFGGSGPGGGTLNDHEISAPLNANLGRFGSCATAEMARGGAVHAVQMRIAVGGTGAPIGLSVANGSGAFKGCVGSVVRSLRWRAFGGPRIGFAWGFSLN